MESETILRQFEQIEQRVENLINACKTLEANNANLKLKIEQLEEDLSQKREAEARHEEERALVRSKIDGLLAKFDITEDN